LQWDDLDFAGREVHVQRALDAQGRVALTKTGSARVVDMSVQLAVALQRLRNERAAETLRRGWPERPPWIFCSEVGTPLDLSNVTKAWRRVLKKAKLPAFRLYDLRHTFATTLLAEGAPLTYVAAQMGHTKPTTTLLWYAHWLPRGDKRWVDALDRAGSREVGSQFNGS
jgi:integrase